MMATVVHLPTVITVGNPLGMGMVEVDTQTSELDFYHLGMMAI